MVLARGERSSGIVLTNYTFHQFHTLFQKAPGFLYFQALGFANFSLEDEQVARLPQSSQEKTCLSWLHWNRNDRMSISLLTACHRQESNKQLHKAKLNSFQIRMGSKHLAFPRRSCLSDCNTRRPKSVGGGSLSCTASHPQGQCD